jgi:peptidoglycan/LPS O-acetylase OafA/YrhL
MASLSIEVNAPARPSLRAESRNAGIDALRASLTLLVLFHHSAVTYGAMGSWFYQEIEPSHAPSSLILTLFVAYNQAFFMGLFFLIAGSLTPSAIARHGATEYLRERLIRLGAPLLVFILVLGPITVALAQTVNGHPFFATLARARPTRRDHFGTDVVRLGAPDLLRRPISSCAP